MSSKERTPGTFWEWVYKDALKAGATIPNFELQGRKGLFGLLGRKTLTSSQIANQKCSVVCFLPKPDHSVDQFASTLANSVKTAVIISKMISHIHLCVTCASLEEFDTKIASRIPSSISIWADVNGEVAEKFGVKPMIAEVDVADILSTNQSSKTKYSKQTVSSMFFCLGNLIVKSPAMQPKMQTTSLDTLKSVLEAIDSAQYNASACMDSRHLASSLTENELRTRHSKAWSIYQLEYGQMQEDLGLVDKSSKKPAQNTPKATKQKTDKTKPVVKKKSGQKKSTKSTANKTNGKKSVKKDDRTLPDGRIRSRL